jgi:fructose-1,6-bisphosphatase II
MSERPSRNLGLDLVRATESAALTAGRWMGLGRPREADEVATRAVIQVLDTMGVQGHTAVGGGDVRGTHVVLLRGMSAGSHTTMDILADPIDGRALLAYGYPGAISVISAAPAGAFQSFPSNVHMDKIVVNADVADALVPECLDAPAAWTLALVARAQGKEIGNLTVFVLDRPRHADLIKEIRATGAHVMLRTEGDVTGALLAASRQSGVDILMGIGGIVEGLISSCAIKALGGAMLGRLAPQSDSELRAIREGGFDLDQIWTGDGLVMGNGVFFAATGITDGALLSGVRYRGNRATSHSMILRGETRTRRMIQAEHLLEG